MASVWHPVSNFFLSLFTVPRPRKKKLALVKESDKGDLQSRRQRREKERKGVPHIGRRLLWFGEKMPPKVALSPFDKISILRVIYGMKEKKIYIVCWLYNSIETTIGS